MDPIDVPFISWRYIWRIEMKLTWVMLRQAWEIVDNFDVVKEVGL